MNLLNRYLKKGFYKALIRLLRHREGDLLPHQLQDIQIPTLLIWGKEDRSRSHPSRSTLS